MSYNFTTLKNHVTETENWLKKEFSSIRTGQATPSILDGVKINSYGAKVSVGNIAGVTIEDAKTLRITPWDKNQIKEIEKAITILNMGVAISVDESGIRVSFPDLTSERRDALIKILKGKFEEAKISLRKVRDDVWGDIQVKEKEGEISEDDKYRFKDEMQKIVEEGNVLFESIAERKEKELTS